jgi:DNA-binding transcriptional regulator YdaS (Cro superfamily)
MEQQAIERACATVGGQANLARAVGVGPQQVWQWCYGYRRVPAERAILIERATAGAVRCEEIRPDVDWGVLRSHG